MAGWRRVSGVAGLAAGGLAAGVGAALAAERVAVGRIRLRPDPEADEPFGRLRGRPLTVLADDGVPLHAEIDGAPDAAVTIIFCHGYTLSQDVWHYQRRDLAGAARLVFYDQRGHGRSGLGSQEHCTIPQLGTDLRAVVTAAAGGDEPVLLVGHSMGGMTIMALAREHPELFGTKVIGAVLISTMAGGVDPTIWIPMLLRPVARHATGPALRGVSTGIRAALAEQGRHVGGDLAFLGTRYAAFGDREVSPTVVDFLERIIRATPVGIVAAFYLALQRHDERAALGILGRVPVIVVAAERDRMVPPEHGEELVRQIPGSTLVQVPGAGHAVILERPDVVNDVIGGLIARTADGGQRRASSA